MPVENASDKWTAVFEGGASAPSIAIAQAAADAAEGFAIDASGSASTAAASSTGAGQALAAAQIARDLALAGIGVNRIFLNQAAGEGATAPGDVFKVYTAATGLVDVRTRTLAGSDRLYLETTTAALNYQAAHSYSNGAVGDNAANDTPVIAALLASPFAVLDPGTYKIQPDTLNGAVFRNQALPEYVGVQILGSGKRLGGGGALRTAVRAGSPSSEVQFALATPQNAGRGAQTDITLQDLTFNVENGAGGTNTNQRGAHFMGVDRLSLLNTTALTKTNRRGAFAYVDNCRDVLMAGFRMYQISGGLNTKYSDNMAIGLGVVNNVNESFDFDGTARGLSFGLVAFKGDASRGQQPIDINGQRDAVFSNLTLNSYGGFTISYKKTTPPDYATFLAYRERVTNNAYTVGDKILVGNGRYVAANSGVSSGTASGTLFTTASQVAKQDVVDGGVTWTYQDDPFTLNPPARVVLGHIAASQMGTANNHVLVIGNEWNDNNYLLHDGYAPASDIVISDFLVDDTTPITILEVKRGRLHGVHLTNVITPANVATFAIAAKSGINSGSSYEWSDLTLSVRDTTVENASLGGMSFTYPRRLLIDNAKTLNCNMNAVANTRDLLIGNLEARGAKVNVLNSEFSGDVQISGSASLIPAWTATTKIFKNMLRTNDGGRFYRACQTGTTAASGGPLGVGKSIIDGTVVWESLDEPYSVVWRDNKVGGAMVLGGDAHRYIKDTTVRLNFGDVAAAGTKLMAFVAPERCVVLRTTFYTTTDTLANAANYRRLDAKSIKSGATNTLNSMFTNITGTVAFNRRNLYSTAAHYGANAMLEKDEVFFVETSSVGTGVELKGLMVEIEVMYLGGK